MRIWAGLDVGVEQTSVCVVDDRGNILQQTTCRSSPIEVRRELGWLRRRRAAVIGVEASSGTNLARNLIDAGYSVQIYETRQLSKLLRANRNKTDAGDAFGIAEAARIGSTLVSRVFLKSLESQTLQSRLTIRQHLLKQRVRGANLFGRQLELFGGRVRPPLKGPDFFNRAELELKSVLGNSQKALSSELRCLLQQLRQIDDYLRLKDQELLREARLLAPCKRFLAIPGVGPMCALSFYSTVGDPYRFKRCTDIGPYLGLTPRLHQSGLTTRAGKISKMGNKQTRTLLVHSAQCFMQWSEPQTRLRLWTLQVEQRRGRRRATVALARKLATIMIAMWKSGADFRSCN